MTVQSSLGNSPPQSAEGRPDAALALVVVGAFFVVVGGLVAAVTGPLDFADGSWLAAYLVLVCGVAQYAMGRIRLWQGSEGSGTQSPAWWQFGSWNLGNAAVIVGTLVVGTLMVVAGSAMLIFALAIALRATWLAALPPSGPVGTLSLWTYRALLVILIVSIPVGILLSFLRNA